MAMSTEPQSDPGPPALTGQQETVLGAASRAPSIHNTQPWRFRITDSCVELYPDPERRLTHADPDGRQLAVSCGAALFGLRLGIRRLGYRPVVDLLPQPAPDGLLARVHVGPSAPLAPDEALLLEALGRRHTHRGMFTGEPLPDGLLVAMQRDAEAEQATLVPVQDPDERERLATLVSAADLWQRQQPLLIEEIGHWTPPGHAIAPDGVPAQAYPPQSHQRPGGFAQRDFDLGRGSGTLPVAGSEAPAATAVLTTPGDSHADWLRAGQALYRLLLRAASGWVFASLYGQPLEVPPLRMAVTEELGLTGTPHMVLQFGRARTATLTGRRPIADLIRP